MNDKLEKVLIGMAAAVLCREHALATFAAETIRRYYRMKGIDIKDTSPYDLALAMKDIMDEVCAVTKAAERN